MIIKNPTVFGGDCFVFINRDIVLHNDGTLLSFQDVCALKERMECGDVFVEPEYNICAMGVKGDAELPAVFMRMPVRLYNDGKEEDVVLRVSRAKALAEWLAATKFCSRCGKPLVPHKTLTAMQCESCGNLIFPRIEPCIIVLVRRGRKMLLARHAQRNQNIYACIAGFMEAGESAEQCVQREIMEETGIKVRNVRYFGSQSWPFPSQLMLGFTAEYESGELKLQEDEIADAGWFDENNCPATPQPGSIAYRLIHET